MAKKNSLKNCKPLVDLIDTATPAALALLSPVECFGFLSAVDRERADHEVRSDIKTVVASLRRDVVAVANQEAVRLLQLMSFRTEMLLQHAFDALTARGGVDLSSFDQGTDAMTRLIWLRSSAPRMFDEIETIYLTHHFHGHKKFHAFAIPDGDGREFNWSDDVGDQLHEAVTEILELDAQAKEACENHVLAANAIRLRLCWRETREPITDRTSVTPALQGDAEGCGARHRRRAASVTPARRPAGAGLM